MAILRDAKYCHDFIINNNADQDPKLSFGWYQIVDQLNAFFNGDPNVKVIQPTGDDYAVTIQAVNPCIAGALATVLKLTYDFGNITGTVHIVSGGLEYGPQPTANLTELLQWSQVAFYGCPRVKKCQIQEPPPGFEGENVVIIVEKTVIQYYNDDLSDIFGNANKTTQDVLTGLLSPAFTDNSSLRVATELNRDTSWDSIGGGPIPLHR
ncbi:MAG: hypothetical protein LBH66_07355 [Oscillospiraceae bacterium]|jgi:hypothetical protein|nr:hypothetical protein [Oscillospiraceae bacterium]